MKETDKNSKDEKALKKALIKKALGFDATEIIEEYSASDEGDIRLTKKKVTKKNVPPDLSAIKMLIDERKTPLTDMSIEELEKEKARLIGTLETKKSTDKEKEIERKNKSQNPAD